MAEDALKKAQAHLDAEEDEQAVQAAAAAVEAFRKASKRNADAFAVLISAYIAQGKRKEASQLATTELASFTKDKDTRGQAKMQLALGEANARGRGSKNKEKALQAAKAAQKLFAELKDKTNEGNAQVLMANLLISKGDAIEALRSAKSAIESFKASGDKRGEGVAQHCLGVVFAKGRVEDWGPEDCTKAVEASIECFKAAGLKKMEAFERICLAKWTSEFVGKPAKALQLALQAQAFCKANCQAQEHVALGMAIECYITMAKKDSTAIGHSKTTLKAIKTALKGVESFEKTGNKLGEASALESLAMAQVARGGADRAAAADVAQRAAKAFEQVGDAGKELEMLKLSAGLYLQQADMGMAASIADSMLKKAKSSGEKVVALETAFNASMRKKEYVIAKDVAKKVVTVLHQEGSRTKEAMAKIMLAQACFKSEDFSGGLAIAREAQTALRDAGDLKGEIRCLRCVAKSHFLGKQFEMAHRYALQARDVCKSLNDPQAEGDIAILIGNIRMQMLLSLDDNIAYETFTEYFFDLLDVLRQAHFLGKMYGSQQLIACAMMLTAQAYCTVAEIPEALKLTEQAAQIFRGLDDNRNLAHLLIVEADAWNIAGENSKANQSVKQALKIFQELQDADGESKALDCMERCNPPTPPPEIVWEDDKKEAGSRKMLAPVEVKKETPSAPGATYERKQLAKINMKKIDPTLLRDTLYDVVQSVVGYDMDFLEDDLPLMQAGIASRQAVTMRAALEEELPGIPFPATIVFDFPSINMITDFVLDNA